MTASRPTRSVEPPKTRPSDAGADADDADEADEEREAAARARRSAARCARAAAACAVARRSASAALGRAASGVAGSPSSRAPRRAAAPGSAGERAAARSSRRGRGCGPGASRGRRRGRPGGRARSRPCRRFGKPATPIEIVARIGSLDVSTSNARVGDRAADPLGDLERLLGRRLRQQDRELLAAEAGRDVVVAQLARGRPRRCRSGRRRRRGGRTCC